MLIFSGNDGTGMFEAATHDQKDRPSTNKYENCGNIVPIQRGQRVLRRRRILISFMPTVAY